MTRAHNTTEAQTQREVSFTVPLVPPSVNHYVKHTRCGRHYVTSEAKAFKSAVAVFARGLEVRGKTYQVDVSIYLAKGQRGDGDNFWKCLLDALVDAGVIHSDAAVGVWGMRVGRDWDNPRTEVRVMVLR